MATYEDTNRSGRKICTMRSLGRDAMDNSPWVLTWQERKKPTMANQVDHAPRRQCRLGCLSAGVACAYGEFPIFGTQGRLRRGLSDLY